MSEVKENKGARADITEIFSSVQGEGIFLGCRQIFIRFACCNLVPRCRYCDTPVLIDAKNLRCSEVLREVRRLVDSQGAYHSVSLTGGEPLVYDSYLMELIPGLRNLNLKIYLETNGTLPQKLRGVINFVDIIAMDMKLPSSTGLRGFWEEHDQFLRIGRSKEIFVKAVITVQTSWQDLSRAVEVVERIDPSIPLVLQPATGLTEKPNTGILLDFHRRTASRLEDVRVIPQIHKLMGVR